MTEVWDDCDTSPSVFQGRIFGTRGRGFRPVVKNIAYAEDSEYGINDFTSNFNEKGGNSTYYKNQSEQDIHNSRMKERNNGTVTGSKKSSYIPKEPSENDYLEDYIEKGINFDSYDDIEVTVTGENVPEKIESFEEAGLLPPLISVIEKLSYTKPTPIQKYAVPVIKEYRDMMACAQTGSGKTAAFLIPIINNLLENGWPTSDMEACSPVVLIIAPTRELAIQNYIEAQKFTKNTKITVKVLYGGTSVRYQKDSVMNGCDILVATPGRLKDFVSRRNVSLRNVNHFIIDEADELLDNNFLPEIEEFLRILAPQSPQLLMFSATFPDKIQSLAAEFMKNHVFIAIGIVGGACADVVQEFMLVPDKEKRTKLIQLLDENRNDKILVFVKEKRKADIIAVFLSEKDIPATSMHGDREQKLREEALRDFKSGKMKVLVATAVAARGLNIRNVNHVINFDLPNTIDEYVHRIGRTGRIGNKGLATSFFDPKKDSGIVPDLIRILIQAGQKVPDFIESAATFGGGYSTSKSNKWDNKKELRGGESLKLEDTSTYEEEVW